MGTLNLLAETDLAITLTGPDWGMPVILKGGNVADQLVYGQVLRNYRTFNDEGEPIIINNPVVILRISDLNPAPQAGQVWHFSIPSTPDDTSEKISYLLDGTYSPEFKHSFGIVKYRLTSVEQSV